MFTAMAAAWNYTVGIVRMRRKLAVWGIRALLLWGLCVCLHGCRKSMWAVTNSKGATQQATASMLRIGTNGALRLTYPTNLV